MRQRHAPGSFAATVSERQPADLTRRRFLAGAGAIGAAAIVGPAAAPSAALAGDGARDARVSPGAGGAPTAYAALAALAREHGGGEPIMFVDLAAVDQNAKVVLDFARQNHWAVRPALKAFQCARLCAYVMELLPEPRGLVFHLRTVDQIMAVAPAGTDLMMGYPPTRGELRAYLGSAPPRGQRRHRLTLMVSSVEILQLMAALARTTPRRLPLDVVLEFDSGEGRGGFHQPQDISAAIKLLRGARDRLRLRATLCYDGHATLTGDETYRRAIATQARQYYGGYLDQLQAEGADLYDAATLVRNGPASANYRNWVGATECNEISPGSAFMYASYLTTFDNQGLAPAVTQCAPVLKDVGPYPTTPISKIPIPPITGEEYYLKGSTWPDQAGNEPPFVYPPGVMDNEREGSRAAVFAPPGSLTPDDYVLVWPNQSGDGVDYFGALTPVRRGSVVDSPWPSFTRWGTPAAGARCAASTRAPVVRPHFTG